MAFGNKKIEAPKIAELSADNNTVSVYVPYGYVVKDLSVEEVDGSEFVHVNLSPKSVVVNTLATVTIPRV